MKCLKYILSFLLYILIIIEIMLVVIQLNIVNIYNVFGQANTSVPSILSISNILIALIIVLLLIALIALFLVRKKQITYIIISLLSASIVLITSSIFVVNMELIRNFNFLNDSFSLSFKTLISTMCYQCVTILSIILIGTIFALIIYKKIKKRLEL